MPRGIKPAGFSIPFCPSPVSTPSQATSPQAYFASYRYPLDMARKSILNYVFRNLLALALTISLAIVDAEAKGGGKGSQPTSSSTSGSGKSKTTKIKDKKTGITQCYNEQ